MFRRIKWFLLSLSFIVVAIIGYYGYSFYQFGMNIQKKDNSLFGNKINAQQTTEKESYTPPKWEGKDRVNILLLGGDSRGLKKNEIPRSDTMMVASVDPVTKKAQLYSILRDTYVAIPGHGKDRINAAITINGPELAMETVSKLMGIPIQYYVYTDFKGFIELVDAVGGIYLDVEKDMKYIDREDSPEYYIDLKKGYQHMDGRTALQYVRFRHDALSDYSRTERQRKFLQALAAELQSTMSIIKLPKILGSIDPYIETNLTITEMLKLGSLGFEVDTSNILSQQIPPTELLKEENVNGASVITVDPKQLQRFVEQQMTEADNESASPSPSPSPSPTPSGSTARK